jgi:hypothetical protein
MNNKTGSSCINFFVAASLQPLPRWEGFRSISLQFRSSFVARCNGIHAQTATKAGKWEKLSGRRTSYER